MDAAEPPFDLDAYLTRVGLGEPVATTVEGLSALHLAHATAVPFENLDLHLGRPIRIDLESLQAKLVRDRRGGYCFEQNTLFAAALTRLGFRVTPLAARVRFGATRVLPRTHMVLKVDVGSRAWVADVGFGSTGLLQPIALEAGPPVRQFAWTYRLVNDAGLWVLQLLQDGTWADLYAFTLEPQYAVDFEMANHFVSTHADSRMRQTLTAQRSKAGERIKLVNRELTTSRPGFAETRTLADGDELLAVLAEVFELRFPPGTRFRAFEAAGGPR